MLNRKCQKLNLPKSLEMRSFFFLKKFAKFCIKKQVTLFYQQGYFIAYLCFRLSVAVGLAEMQTG